MPFDKKEYGPNWPQISHHIRFERAQGRCEWCGAEHGKPHPRTGSTVWLTTAHIDRNNQNHDPANLAALCQACHLGHDRAQHTWSRKYGRKSRHQPKLPF